MPARKGLGEFMAFLANEAEICIAVIAGGWRSQQGLCRSAAAQAGAAQGCLLNSEVTGWHLGWSSASTGGSAAVSATQGRAGTHRQGQL